MYSALYSVVFEIKEDFYENVGELYLQYVPLMRHIRTGLAEVLGVSTSQVWNVVAWPGDLFLSVTHFQSWTILARQRKQIFLISTTHCLL